MKVQLFMVSFQKSDKKVSFSCSNPIEKVWDVAKHYTISNVTIKRI